jgi:hypothetical protein
MWRKLMRPHRHVNRGWRRHHYLHLGSLLEQAGRDPVEGANEGCMAAGPATESQIFSQRQEL